MNLSQQERDILRDVRRSAVPLADLPLYAVRSLIARGFVAIIDWDGQRVVVTSAGARIAVSPPPSGIPPHLTGPVTGRLTPLRRIP